MPQRNEARYPDMLDATELKLPGPTQPISDRARIVLVLCASLLVVQGALWSYDRWLSLDFSQLEPYRAQFTQMSTQPTMTPPWQWQAIVDGYVHPGGIDGKTRYVWYRLVLPPVPASPDNVIYFPRLNANADLYVNGVRVGSGGPVKDGRAPLHVGPLTLPLPETTGEVVLKHYSAKAHWMSPAYAGPPAVFEPFLKKQQFVHERLPPILSGVAIVLALLFAGIYTTDRSGEKAFGIMSLALVLLAVRVQIECTVELPVPYYWWIYLGQTSYFGNIVQTFLLVHLFALPHRRAPYFALAIGLIILVGGALAIANDPAPGFAAFQRSWVVFVLGVVSMNAYLHVRAIMQSPDYSSISTFVAFTLLMAAGFHDSYVEFYEPAWHAFLVPTAVSVMVMNYAGLIVFRYHRNKRALEGASQAMAEQLEQQAQALAANHAQIRELEKSRTLAEERRRIMRDVHDGLGSQLIQAISLVDDGKPHGQLKETLAAALTDLRFIVSSLNPNERHLEGMIANFKHLFTRSTEHLPVTTSWHMSNLDSVELCPERSLRVLRMLQESLTNVLKHANATHIDVHLECSDDLLYMRVNDDGCGFDANNCPNGVGLNSLRERALQLNGHVAIDSNADGTCVRATIPIRQPLREVEAP